MSKISYLVLSYFLLFEKLEFNSLHNCILFNQSSTPKLPLIRYIVILQYALSYALLI